jgi:hypothetical protein
MPAWRGRGYRITRDAHRLAQDFQQWTSAFVVVGPWLASGRLVPEREHLVA